jgi:probable rRNA maturation factor
VSPELAFTIRNRQRVCRLDTRLLRRILRHYLREIIGIDSGALCFHLVDAPEMTRVNGRFLNHAGSTDVITFDHQEDPGSAHVYGEIFISVPDAVKQARQFRTTWTAEIVRYAVHGVLHLCGYDDLTEPERREMKRAENRCLRKLRSAFNFAALDRS